MKALVYAYINNNFGDDLFLDILVSRYPKIEFNIIKNNKSNMDFLKKYGNVKFININFIKKMLNYVGLKLFNVNIYYKNLAKKFDLSIMIGGSMFMEKDGWKKRYYQLRDIMSNPLHNCIIGVNFGPFKSNEFFSKYMELFKQMSYVCFRDNYSFGLFEKIENAHVSTDIAFNLDNYSNLRNDIDLLISVCNIKNNVSKAQFYKNYINTLKKVALDYINHNKKVVIISMCPSEGDEHIADRIKEIDPEGKIETVTYTGKIDLILEYMKRADKIIATRFHSMIIGLLYKKKITPIIYNEKMSNVLEDIKYSEKYYKLNELNKFKLNDKSFNNVEEYKKYAKIQFKYIDNLVYGKGSEIK